MAKSEARTELGEGGLWLTRRDFFRRAGWGAFLATLGGLMFGTVRFFFPKVLFGPATSFKADSPEDYIVGTVSERWKKGFGVCIIREAEGIYALSYKCTHLGCAVNWSETENKFKCPCHGSGFYRSGINFEGPAPRPLERFGIALAEDGQIVVDKSRIFRHEKGEWDDPGAFLRV